MSRSAIAGLVFGLLLLGALAIVESHYWHGFADHRSGLVIGLVLTLGIYGALLAAVSFRRIIDPWLPTPILAWILMWIWWVIDFITDLMRPPADVVIVEEVVVYDDDGVAHDDGMGLGWAIFMTLIGLGMYAGGIALTRYLGKHPVHHSAPHVVKHHEPRPEPPRPDSHVPDSHKPSHVPDSHKPDSHKASKLARIDDAKDLAAAIAFAMPNMTSETDAPSVGTRDLARYAAKHLHWKDVAVGSNETSLALAEKDIAKSLGKRLCESGTLERIQKQHLWGVELHAARMVTRSGDALEMLVAGNTGTLVKRNPTRFCGVIAGRLAASGGNGGQPATLAVGMFETAK